MADCKELKKPASPSSSTFLRARAKESSYAALRDRFRSNSDSLEGRASPLSRETAFEVTATIYTCPEVISKYLLSPETVLK